MEKGGWLAIGVVKRPHGIHGKIRVQYYGDHPVNFLALKEIRLGLRPEDSTSHPIQFVQAFKELYILTLKDFGLRDAQASAGQYLWIHRDQLPPLEEDEYYWVDLIGLRVLTDSGEDVGIVSGLMPTGSNDVLICKAEGREILIPFVEGFVLRVDFEQAVILIRPVEGLL